MQKRCIITLDITKFSEIESEYTQISDEKKRKREMRVLYAIR